MAQQLVDHHAEYRPLEGVDPTVAVALRDYAVGLLTPMQAGRTDRFYLTAATMPLVREFDCTGRQTCPANSPVEQEMNLTDRVLSVELWNYDTTNALQIDIIGVSRRPLNLAANTYYSMDCNASPQLVVRVRNTTASPVDYQVKVNGI